jgi:hypothetical protein
MTQRRGISDTKATGTLMALLIAVLLVGIFVELGGFATFFSKNTLTPVVPLEEVPVVAIASTTSGRQVTETLISRPATTTRSYIQIKDSCDFAFRGECVRIRSGAGLSEPVVGKLRTGMVLAYSSVEERDGMRWYKIVFDEWLRYPERVASDWYVSADYVEEVQDSISEKTSTTKKILVDRGDQTLRAVDGDMVFLETDISTGLELTPTPRGTFTVFQKTPTRYMQGPLPYLTDQSYYDVPGVPWNLYFTEQGAVIHGAYWHNSFGTPYSHGCVNLKPDEAKKLYEWASLGTQVIVVD